MTFSPEIFARQNKRFIPEKKLTKINVIICVQLNPCRYCDKTRFSFSHRLCLPYLAIMKDSRDFEPFIRKVKSECTVKIGCNLMKYEKVFANNSCSMNHSYSKYLKH